MESIHTEKRTCHSCGNPLRGRVDKKFCNDYCRNNFNNEQKTRNRYSPVIRNINNALLKNRRILATVLTDQMETARANRDKLLRLGFHFGYQTHVYTTKTGRSYYYCYDYGYLALENDWYLIVKKKEE
jgi:predicted nucleic acid-binding Zn ribbon protein